MKKSYHVDVIITDGSKTGKVLTVKRTGKGPFIILDPFVPESHLTIPPNGRIHDTFDTKGSEPPRNYWILSNELYLYEIEFNVSDPRTWGSEPREQADETVCFDISSNLSGTRSDILNVAVSVLEPEVPDLKPDFAYRGDVLMYRLIEYSDGWRLAVAIYDRKK